MQQFFKFAFASCLGVFIAGILLFIVMVAGVAGVAGSEDETVDVKPNSVLELDIDQNIPELTDNVEKDFFEQKKTLGLQDVVASLRHAETDKDIKGIILKGSSLGYGTATASTLRKALLEFKKSGKFIIAYSDYYSQGGYYMASVSDKILVNPYGMVDFRGFSSQIPFFKDMFDRLGIKSQVYYAGQFKSATEPFRYTKMSDQNRLQTREFQTALYDNFLKDIADSRKITVSDLRNIADNCGACKQAKDIVGTKLIDGVAYYDEILADLKKRLGLKEKDKIASVNMSDYFDTFSEKQDYKVKDRIAVIYAEGSIGQSDGKDETNGSIDGNRYAKIIRKLRQDDNVKGIVLRVNSGGGSALASEVMLRELDLAKAAGKPVIASFGDVAASGGYYIACHADSIFCEPSTITGSIGVFSFIPSLQDLMNKKLGISFDTVGTGKYSTGFTAVRDFNAQESVIMQAGVDSIYETFLQRVALGRKMSRDQVHAIAQGRVWAGTKAKEIGLVDRFGSLDDAIAAAAQKAGLKKYRTSDYPRLKEPFQKFIEKMTGKHSHDEAKAKLIKAELGEFGAYYDQFKSLQQMKGYQMRMPFEMIHFK